MIDQEQNKHLSDIKNLMYRSSQFQSLSGASSILSGIYALIGATIVKFFLLPKRINFTELNLDTPNLELIALTLFVVAFLSVWTTIAYSKKKAQFNKEKLWGQSSKRLMVNFLIPLGTGTVYIAIHFFSDNFQFVTASMLIFYGLALVNASRYTIDTLKYLGIGQIILGLVCTAFPEWGFWLWSIGFGLFHIIYGGLLLVEDKENRS